MLLDINKKEVCIYKIKSLFNSRYVIEIGDEKYILIYGEKISNNFFVNIYYIFTRGSCREVKSEINKYGVLLDKDARYVQSKRVAINYFLSHFSSVPFIRS